MNTESMTKSIKTINKHFRTKSSNTKIMHIGRKLIMSKFFWVASETNKQVWHRHYLIFQHLSSLSILVWIWHMIRDVSYIKKKIWKKKSYLVYNYIVIDLDALYFCLIEWSEVCCWCCCNLFAKLVVNISGVSV